MTTVNLANKKIAIRVHPVLREQIDVEFLTIANYPKSIVGKLETAQKHLAHSSPVVTRGETKKVYYVVCPLLAVLSEEYGQALFEKLTVKAWVRDLSDDEVLRRFWFQVRQAFSLTQVCRGHKTRLVHANNNGLDSNINPKPKLLIKGFKENIDHLVTHSKPITEDLLGGPLVQTAGKLSKEKTSLSATLCHSRVSKSHETKAIRNSASDERQLKLGLG